MIKFTDLSLNSNIQWFIIDGPVGDRAIMEFTAVTPHETDST